MRLPMRLAMQFADDLVMFSVSLSIKKDCIYCKMYGLYSPLDT